MTGRLDFTLWGQQGEVKAPYLGRHPKEIRRIL